MSTTPPHFLFTTYYSRRQHQLQQQQLHDGETSRRAHGDPKPASASALALDFIVCACGRKVAATSDVQTTADFSKDGDCVSLSIPCQIHDTNSAIRLVKYSGQSYRPHLLEPRDWRLLHSGPPHRVSVKPRLSKRPASHVSEARSRSLLLQILLHHRTLFVLRSPINIDIALSSSCHRSNRRY